MVPDPSATLALRSRSSSEIHGVSLTVVDSTRNTGVHVTFLENPERQWALGRPPSRADRSEVDARLGPTPEELVLLSGGHANLNIRVGLDRVLRIYRRDPAASKLEATLLRKGWEDLRVPRVLEVGPDFLVLEYVAHVAAAPEAQQAVATGRALAEIHRIRFSQAGFLDSQLKIRSPFPDVVGGFREYVVSQLARTPEPLPGALAPALEARLASRQVARHVGPPVLLHGDFKASNLHWTDAGELLVLDWEFSYAGPALMDVGQLLRWDPPPAFIDTFAKAYRSHGGVLAPGWRDAAAAFDLVNLVGMLARTPSGSNRASALLERIQRTLAAT